MCTTAPEPWDTGITTACTIGSTFKYCNGADNCDEVKVLPKHRSRIKVSCPEGYLLIQYDNWSQQKQKCLEVMYMTPG